MDKIDEMIYRNEKLRIFGDGSTSRNYTYVDDIIAGIMKAVDYKNSKFETFNLGNGNPIKLTDIISLFELKTGQKVNIEFVDSIKGESDITWANNDKAKRLMSFEPNINISEGIKNYLDWYKKQL